MIPWILSVPTLVATVLPVPQGDSLPQAADQRLAEVIDAYHAAGVFGGTVSVSRGADLLLERAWGVADADTGRANTAATPVQIASVTKPLVAIALLRLVDAGRLDLDDTLAARLPGFTPDFGAKVTLRQILGHRASIARDTVRDTLSISGFPGKDGRSMERDELLEFLNENLESLAIEPDTRRFYSNSGYRLLSMVIEEELGLDHAQCLDQLLFEPVGMKSSRANPGFPGGDLEAFGHQSQALRTAFCRSANRSHMIFARGCGDVVATAGDLGRLVLALLDGDLLSAESSQLVLETVLDGATLAFEREEVTFEGELTVALSHSGGFEGYSAHLVFLPKKGVSVAVLANVDAAPAATIARDLLVALDGRDTELPAPACGDPLLAALARDDLGAARDILDRLPTPAAESGFCYGASRATGQPELPTGWPKQKNLTLAWAPAGSDGLEWLELHYSPPVEAERLRIFGWALGTYAVEGIEPGGATVALEWQNLGPTTPPGGRHQYDAPLEPVRLLEGLRIHLDGTRVRGHAAVDAVALCTAGGEMHWANTALASSSMFSRALQLEVSGLRPDILLLEEGARDLFDLGRDDEALALLRFAAEYAPHGVRGAESLARGLIRVGRPRAAVGLLKSVLAAAEGREPARRLLEEIVGEDDEDAGRR